MPTEQASVPQKQQKRYTTRSNAIPLKWNQYLKQASRPAEPLDQDIESNKASLERTPNMVSTVKTTIAKALRYSKSAKSLLWSKRCYKCKGTGHQAKDCSYGWPQELLVDQDDNTLSSTYQPLPHYPVPTILPEERGRTAYRLTRYVNLTDSLVFEKQGNSLLLAGNVFKWARSQSPRIYRGLRYPKPNKGQLLHRYGRPALETLESSNHKWAHTLSPTQIIHKMEIDDDTLDLEAEEDIATELVWHTWLDTFDQEQIRGALQNLLKDALKDINWQLAHTARLWWTIMDDWVYMSARKSMTVRFYTHSAKKWVEGIALVDSGATENFLSLDYTQWLGLPIKHLEKPRQLFNIDGTRNKVGALWFYTDVSLQTGNQHTNHHFFLSDLGDNKAIFGYPWFASVQPNIDWARGWIDSSQLRQAEQDILPEELKTIPLEYHHHLKVFSKKAAACLLPDHPWNHAIKLKPNALASIRGRIYPLT